MREAVCEREWEEGEGGRVMEREKGGRRMGKKKGKKEKKREEKERAKTAEHQVSKGRLMMANRKLAEITKLKLGEEMFFFFPVRTTAQLKQPAKQSLSPATTVSRPRRRQRDEFLTQAGPF